MMRNSELFTVVAKFTENYAELYISRFIQYLYNKSRNIFRYFLNLKDCIFTKTSHYKIIKIL